jgi:predicted dehydrogenase
MAAEHLRAFADHPEVALVGIHSRTAARAESLAEAHSVDACCESVAELYETQRPDLVVITVSVDSVLSVTMEALEYPWVILVEKPPGMNLQEATAIHEEQKAHERSVLVALNRRFYASTRAVYEGLAATDGPRFIHVQDQQDLECVRRSFPPAVADNFMYANSIHVIDYLTHFARGDVASVNPIIAWQPDDPFMVVVAIEFSSGDRGLYEGVWKGPGPWSVSVTTPEQRWELRPLETMSYQVRGSREIVRPPSDPIDAQFKPGLRLQAEHAVRFSLGRESSAVRLEEALDTMKLIDAVFRPG